MALSSAPSGIHSFLTNAKKSTESPNPVSYRWGAVVSREISGTTYQAICYHNTANVVVVGVRTLPSGSWSTYTTGSLSADDQHNMAVLAIDADGYLHVSYDHHNDPLNYRKSNLPLSSWTGTFTAELSMLGTNEGAVSYPAFFVAPSGELYFTFRSGGSGSGDTFLYVYDESTTSWSAATGAGSDGILLEGTTGSPDYSFYPFEPPTFSSDWDGAGTGYMHLAYTKRRTTALDNSDIYHITYDGTSFYKTDGTTSQTIPATASNLTTAVTISESELLLNNGGFCLDANNRPHIAYWKDDGTRYQLYHSYHNGSSWVTAQLTSYSSGTIYYTDVGRPAMRCDLATNTIYIWYTCVVGEGDGIYEYSSDPADFTTWTKNALYEGAVDCYEPTLDVAQWEENGLVSMLVTRGHNAESLVDHVPILITGQAADIGGSITADGEEMVHVATITVDHTSVVADLTDYRVYVDLSDLPASFWNLVTDGGGDIRCYKSDDVTQLPRDVVSCHTATDTGELHIKYTGTLSSTVDTVIHIYADGTSSEPAVDSAYGRNAVWDDYEAVYHFDDTPTGSAGDITDSAGNHSGTSVSMGAGNAVAGIMGDGALEFDGSADYVSCGLMGGIGGASALTLQCWIKPDTIEDGESFISGDWNTTANQRSFLFAFSGTDELIVAMTNEAGSPIDLETSTDANLSTTAVSISSVWETATDTITIYKNGTAVSSTPGGSGITTLGSVANWGTILGGRYNGTLSNPFDGVMDELRISTVERSADWIATEYANQSAPGTFYAVEAAGGGVTGTGDLVGAGSEVVGTGTRTVTGAGTLEGQGAAVVGTGERIITGTGALIGQGSDVAGTGATGGVHTGTGDLIGAGSEIVGVGERTVTGAGALIAQGSAVVGVGERTVTGFGDLVGAGAEVSGSGAVGGITTGTGDLVGAGSEIVGVGIRTVTGSGTLVAQGSAVTGTGERVITGAGALVGSGSEIVGAGVGGDVTTGAGALVGQGSAVTGTGTRKITGIGDLVAAGSIIVGAGVRTITGSGALVGAGSEVIGGQTEHDFETGNINTWMLGPRGRLWSLENRDPYDAHKRGREVCSS